ncbi:MAG TPA: tetratricopeptide repeat protein [Bacteroidales bacterium]|nr:tetratricopeptide repeat protein [Bacteroidales bacterium]
MFSDWDNFYEDDETLDVLKRYREMVDQNISMFFDLYEYECIIDYYIDKFNFKDAFHAIGFAIKQHPHSSALKLKYIQLLIENGKPGKALGIIRCIQDAESTNYELFLAKGIALNLTGKFNEAQSEFRKALQLCTENRDELAYSIAQSFIQIDKSVQAVKYLQLAFEYNQDNLLVLYDLAMNYERLDFPEKGILYYKKYLDLDPFAEHVWNNLGLLYSSLDDFEHACEAFDFATAINIHYFSAYFNKADLFFYRNDMPGAIQVYREVLAQDVTNTRALCDLGNCYEENGNYEEALRSFKSAILIAQDCADAWFGKGMVYFRQKRYRLSISCFKKTVSIQSDNSDYWFMLGEAFSRSRRLDQAIDAYSRASSLNPLDYEAWMACAQVLFRKKRVGEAIGLLAQLYQYNHENPTINYRLAAYHAYQQDYMNAIKYFERGLKLNYHEHHEMFKLFPKTKSVPVFWNLLENHFQSNPPLQKIK